MKKIILLLKLFKRAKFIFKTPKKYDLVVFDHVSIFTLKNCLSKLNYFVLQVRLEDMDEIYFTFKILKKIFSNYFKGNLMTVYLTSLIELIQPKAVVTIIDNSLKFSDIAKIFEDKINFIAIQNASRYDLLQINYLYSTKRIKHNFLKKYYIPNFFCFGDYERDLYKKLNIKVKNLYPAGDLKWANFLEHIKAENSSLEKYNSDICLIAQYLSRNIFFHGSGVLDKYMQEKINDPKLLENINILNHYVNIVKYTIKFCIKNNMKLIIPLKRLHKETPQLYRMEIDFFKNNLNKEEFDYFKKSSLERDVSNFSSHRAVLNSKVTVGLGSTLLCNKLASGGKILSCNLSKLEMYNLPINGICSINNCTFQEFEKRLLEVHSISPENFLSKIDKNPDYIMKFSKNYSTIDLIREKLSHLGVS